MERETSFGRSTLFVWFEDGAANILKTTDEINVIQLTCLEGLVKGVELSLSASNQISGDFGHSNSVNEGVAMISSSGR